MNVVTLANGDTFAIPDPSPEQIEAFGKSIGFGSDDPTAVAGQLAMEPVGPWNIALAAVMLASGLAQVAKIESTQPGTKGSGFDNPSNDRAAYIGGRRWAADMIGEFTSGVSAGWASGMGGRGGSSNVTYDNRSTTNLHWHGAGMLDPNNMQMMKQFSRNLAVVNKVVEGQRRIGRTAR